MSYDPGPLDLVNFAPSPMARVLSLFQSNVARWIDRIRSGEGWDDLQASAIEGLATSALTTGEVPESSGCLFKIFRHDQTDDLTFTKQFSHKWTGSRVRPHLHLMPLASGTGNIAMSWKYAWLPVGGKLDSFTDMGEVQYEVTPEKLYQHIIMPLGFIDPPSTGLTSAFLIVFVERNRDGGDTYDDNKGWGTIQANLALLGMDTHHTQRIFGTETLYR